nr:MAG TPA: hypothetical protein [Caudoviricetes sp.]
MRHLPSVVSTYTSTQLSTATGNSLITSCHFRFFDLTLYIINLTPY